MTREWDVEEAFHSKDRKQWRKERKRAVSSSQIKKKEKLVSIKVNPHWGRGRVVAITGEGIWIDSLGDRFLASMKGVLKKEKRLAKNILAVGDIVRFTTDHAIALVEDRYSFLSRLDVTGKKEQLIAVNIDQAIITISVVNPPLKPGLIDRYIIAAQKGNIHPIIVINKIDLLQGNEEELFYNELVHVYEKLGFPLLSVSTTKLIGLESLKALLKDKTSVFAGQSGVGKSSLINACYGFELKTGDLTQKTKKGSHTTTKAELIPLPGGGYCVDTPGIRSFGIWKLNKDEVTAYFKDFLEFPCKYPDCQHLKEPQCGVLQALKEGAILPIRYESYKTLLDESLGKVKLR